MQEVGCDFGINSNAVEDRCGVCLGDGSSCETVYNLFNEGEGFGEFIFQENYIKNAVVIRNRNVIIIALQ